VTDEDEQSETERALPAKPVKIKKGKEKEVLTYESEEECQYHCLACWGPAG